MHLARHETSKGERIAGREHASKTHGTLGKAQVGHTLKSPTLPPAVTLTNNGTGTSRANKATAGRFA